MNVGTFYGTWPVHRCRIIVVGFVFSIYAERSNVFSEWEKSKTIIDQVQPSNTTTTTPVSSLPQHKLEQLLDAREELLEIKRIKRFLHASP